MKALKLMVGVSLLVGAGYLYLVPATLAEKTATAPEVDSKRSEAPVQAKTMVEAGLDGVREAARSADELSATLAKTNSDLGTLGESLEKRGQILDQLKILEKEFDEQRLSATKYSERRQELVKELRILLSPGE